MGNPRKSGFLKKNKNQQMLSEIQPINSERRDEQNLKTTTQIRLKIRQLLL